MLKVIYRNGYAIIAFKICLITFATKAVVKLELSYNYLQHYPVFVNERITLLNSIRQININALEQSDSVVTIIFRYGDTTLITHEVT